MYIYIYIYTYIHIIIIIINVSRKQEPAGFKPSEIQIRSSRIGRTTYSDDSTSRAVSRRGAAPAAPLKEPTPGLHDKIRARKIFARGWVAQESIVLYYQR